jgi:hypothetical protein
VHFLSLNPVIIHGFTHHIAVFLFDEAAIVFAIGTAPGEPDLLHPLLDPAMGAVEQGVLLGPAGTHVGAGEGLAELAGVMIHKI